MTFLAKLIDNVIQERIRTSVIAVLVTGWVFVNHVGIANFILSDNEVRKTIVANYRLWDSDLPLIVGYFLLYTALVSFVFPFLSLKINHFKIRFIIEKQEEQDKNNKERNYKNKGYLSLAREKSTPSYAKKLIDKELENWIQDRNKLISDKDLLTNKNKNNKINLVAYQTKEERNHQIKSKLEKEIKKLKGDLISCFFIQNLSLQILKQLDAVSILGTYTEWINSMRGIIPSTSTLKIETTTDEERNYGQIPEENRASYINRIKEKVQEKLNIAEEKIEKYKESTTIEDLIKQL